MLTYGLTTITWPSWQCGPVAQYRNMVSALVTGMLNVPTVVWPSWNGICPLCMAVATVACKGWHGESAALCVTVWFPLLNWNWIMSPTAAATVLGTKVS